MGALKFYWHRPEVDIESKIHIYKACVVTILLWGAKTWAFTPTHGKRLEVFHHRSLRNIFWIKWQQMKEERIKNKEVRRRFGNIKMIQAIICDRKLTYIRHVVRERKFPSTALSAFINLPCSCGRPRCAARSTVLQHLTELLPNIVVDDRDLHTWTKFTKDERQWKDLITRKIKPSEYRHDNDARTSPRTHQTSHSSTSSSTSSSTPLSTPPSTPLQHGYRRRIATIPQTTPLSPPPQRQRRRQRQGERMSINHKLLGIIKDDTLRTATVAYQRLARELHPDKWTTSKLFTREEGSERFKAIVNAYERVKTDLEGREIK